jgi:hypothetical protein
MSSRVDNELAFGSDLYSPEYGGSSPANATSAEKQTERTGRIGVLIGAACDSSACLFPPMPQYPSRADAEAALKQLRKLIETFPFVN